MHSEPPDDSPDVSITTDDSTNAPHGGPDTEACHSPDTRRRVLAATLQAEAELLEHRCEELAATNEELQAEVEDLEAELERKRRELREVVTRYERLLSEDREQREDGDAVWTVRSDGSAVLATATRVYNRVFYLGP